MREVVSHVGEWAPDGVVAKGRRKVVHRLADHNQVIPDCSNMRGVPFDIRSFRKQHANLDYRIEDVVETFMKISWAQSATASA